VLKSELSGQRSLQVHFDELNMPAAGTGSTSRPGVWGDRSGSHRHLMGINSEDIHR
jgi:hypothetical protein